MELRDYLDILRKRWLSILLITVLVTGAAVAVTLVATPEYTARSQVYVSIRTVGATTSDLLQGSNFAQRQVKSYTELVTSPRVLVPVIEHLDLSTTPDDLAPAISASSPLDTSLINIQVTDPDPQTASDIANSVAENLATQVAELEQPATGPSPVEISTVRPATRPDEPSSPNTTRNVALGFLLGLAAGFGLAVLREVLDTRVRTADDVRLVTDASVMTVIAHDDDAAKHPLVVQSAPHSARAEAFRRLRTNLQFLDVADRLESIVVTSSIAREGKTTVAVNLAITLADAGSRVALVDADLRRPSIAEFMGLEGRAGLTTVLIGQATLEDVIQPWGAGNLHVLPSGQLPPNPSEMVGSHAMAWLLGELVKQYDVVILDTPPLLPVTDAAILARLAGGALMVVNAGNHLHRAELGEAMTALNAVGGRVLGIVLNNLTRKQSGAYAYYGHGTGELTRRRNSSRRTASSRQKSSQGAATHSSDQRGPARTSTRVARPSTPVAGAEGGLDDIFGSQDPPAAPRPWPGEPIG